MFIFLQETQISFDLYAAVICVALKQNKHASELPLLGKNIPKDHDGIFPPVLPTSISVPPIDINLALFPSGNCVIFSIFLDNRLLFKHQQLNASPYGFASVYRQCSCVITVCTRKSPVCHKVCNFNKIYCPFSRCNINKDNVHKSIILWSRSVHEKRCIGVLIKPNIYRKCWNISSINEDLTILSIKTRCKDAKISILFTCNFYCTITRRKRNRIICLL